MTNTIRKLGLVGLAALTLAGCNGVKNKTTFGSFRGHDTMVNQFKDGSAEVSISSPNNFSLGIIYANEYILIGYRNKNGQFDRIETNDIDVRKNSHANKESPLNKYANPDSLNLAYHLILEQNQQNIQYRPTGWVK